VYPKPDLTIYLDAPPEVLFERKGEGTLEFLERRGREYLQIQDQVPHFARVDAALPADEVAAQVRDLIVNFYASEMRSGSRSNGASRTMS
jgi:thymidylate kinase